MTWQRNFQFFSYINDIKVPFGLYFSKITAIHDARNLAIRNDPVIVKDKNLNKIWDSRIDE